MSWTCTNTNCWIQRDNVAGAGFCCMCGYAQYRRSARRDADSFRNSLFDGVVPEHSKWVPRKDRLDPLYILSGSSRDPDTRYLIGGQSFIVSGRPAGVASMLAAGIAIVQPGQAFNPNEPNFRNLWTDDEQCTILKMFHAAGVCIARVQTVADFYEYVVYRSTDAGIATMRFLVEIGSLNPFATQYPWNIKGATHFNGNALVDVRDRIGLWHTAVIVDNMIRYLVIDREEQVDKNTIIAPPFTKIGFPFPYGTCIYEVAANCQDGRWLYHTLQEGVATWRQKLRRCRNNVAVIEEIPRGVRNLIVGYMIGGWA